LLSRAPLSIVALITACIVGSLLIGYYIEEILVWPEIAGDGLTLFLLVLPFWAGWIATERRRRAAVAEAEPSPALRRRLMFLEGIAVGLSDGLIICEEAEGRPGDLRIVDVNGALCRLTGYAEDELVGRSPKLLQGPDIDRATLDVVREAVIQSRKVRVELRN
jgi:PAS domain-containing protein